MKNHITTLALMATTIIGCTIYSHPSYSADQASQAIVSYDGKSLTAADLDHRAKEMFGGKLPEDKQHFSDLPTQAQENIIRGMVTAELLQAQANKAGIEQTAEYKAALERAKSQLLQNEFLRKEVLLPKINEKTVKQRYEKYAKEMSAKKEMHLFHILVDSEEKAKEVAAELKAGKSFEEVAKAKSIDSTTKEKGGDLGYLQKDQILKPVADAAFILKNGDISAPVKTDLGWHVLKAGDVRDVKAPEYEQVQKEMEQQLMRETVEAYIDGMLKSAKFKITFPAAAKTEAAKK
jgi:peptidyl-prolyl cis-trans isomerase C